MPAEDRSGGPGPRPERCVLTVAVVGQPSTGKSTFFSHVTGKIERVASWPGTTVEQKIARVRYRDMSICLVDLPGIYGLSVTSFEESVTKKFLLLGNYDVVLVLVDPLVIERSIYLPLQIAEMGVRVVVAVTKWDIIHKHGVHIDVEKLSSRLGFPVLPISSITGEGVGKLLDSVVRIASSELRWRPLEVDYGPLNSYIDKLAAAIEELKNPNLSKRWVAERLLEGDPEVSELVGSGNVLQLAGRLREEFRKVFGTYPEDVATYMRFRKASEVLEGAVVRVRIKRGTLAAGLDRVFLSPKLGIVASVGILFIAFLAAFTVNTGFPLNVILRFAGMEQVAEVLETYSLSGLIGEGFAILSEYLRSFLGQYSVTLATVLADGVVGGVGMVLSFAPLVLVVSAVISVIEDSGLGPRMVASLHSFFSGFGLSGRSLYPLVLGFGCNVPAVMQSRIAIDEYERKQVIASAPFVLCQARLVVMMYFTNYLFPGQPLLQASTMLLLYSTSILLFLLTSKLVRRAVFKVRENPELVMEIPPLHRPSARVVWWNSWLRAKHFLVKAGTVIFVMALASWFMVATGPRGFTDDPASSYAAIAGSAIGKFFELIYKVDSRTSWKVGYALLYGTVAKEGLITSVAQLSAVEEGKALEVLGLNPAQAISLLVLFMFYIPCAPTIAAIYRESESAKFTIGVTLYMVTTSVVLSTITYYTLSTLWPA